MTRIIRRLKGLVVEEADEGSRAAIKEVRFGEHFMRKNQSYGISLDVVQELNRLGVDLIELHVTDKNEILYCDMDDFNRLSTIEQYPPYEEQAFLHISKWKKIY
jgi:hypothetical protein